MIGDKAQHLIIVNYYMIGDKAQLIPLLPTDFFPTPVYIKYTTTDQIKAVECVGRYYQIQLSYQFSSKSLTNQQTTAVSYKKQLSFTLIHVLRIL